MAVGDIGGDPSADDGCDRACDLFEVVVSSFSSTGGTVPATASAADLFKYKLKLPKLT